MVQKDGGAAGRDSGGDPEEPSSYSRPKRLLLYFDTTKRKAAAVVVLALLWIAAAVLTADGPGPTASHWLRSSHVPKYPQLAQERPRRGLGNKVPGGSSP